MLAHAADPEVFRSIHNWVLTEELYVAEDWFGMNDLDFQLPTNPFVMVITFRLHMFSILSFFFQFVSLFYPWHFLQTCKVFIKVFVCNDSVLNVRTTNFEDMGYNLKRDGWLNCFIDVKNQSMRGDEVPWRGAHEKRPEFFSVIFSTLTDKDWQCGVGLFFTSLFFISLFFMFLFLLLLVHFPFIYLSSSFCILLFWEVPSLHAAPFNAILWRLSRTLIYLSPSSSPFVSMSKSTPLNTSPFNEALCLLVLPGRWQSAILICCARKFVLGFYLVRISIFSYWILGHVLMFFFLLLCAEFKMRVPSASLLRTCSQRL